MCFFSLRSRTRNSVTQKFFWVEEFSQNLTYFAIFFNFWQKFGILRKVEFLTKKMEILQKVGFLIKIRNFTKSWMFDKKLELYKKLEFWFLTKNLELYKKLEFWLKFWFLTKILISDKKSLIFDKNNFWKKV